MSKRDERAARAPDGMCNDCTPYAGSATVKLCPLHAAAAKMLAALEAMLDDYLNGQPAWNVVDQAEVAIAAAKGEVEP